MTDRVIQMHYGVMHPMFKEQLHSAPPGYRYESYHPGLRDDIHGPKRVAQGARRIPRLRSITERAAVRTLSRLGYVHHSRARPMQGAVLIHSCERLLYRSTLPYVLDFENASLFVLYQRLALDRPWARTWLMRALEDDRLRLLLPWTSFARRSLFASLGGDSELRLAPRTEVVYPAIRPAVTQARKRSRGPLRLLFIGTAFLEKGAVEAISAVRRLANTHDVHLDLLSFVPDRWASELRQDPVVTLHNSGQNVDIRALYDNADALLFPSHMDTFGFVILEAMAHGIPVIAPSHPPFDEIVEHEQSGLLFPPENQLFDLDGVCRFPKTLPPPRRFRRSLQEPSDSYVDGIASTIARVTDDHALYQRLAEGAYGSTSSGRFSVDARRRALTRIYDAASD